MPQTATTAAAGPGAVSSPQPPASRAGGGGAAARGAATPPYALVVGGLIVLLMVILVAGATGGMARGRGGSKGGDRDTLELLATEAARWAVTSRSNTNPLIALMQANYAVGYLNVAQKLGGSDEAISNATGRDAAAFYREALALQAQAIQRTTALAPSLAPPANGVAATLTGWLAA